MHQAPRKCSAEAGLRLDGRVVIARAWERCWEVRGGQRMIPSVLMHRRGTEVGHSYLDFSKLIAEKNLTLWPA